MTQFSTNDFIHDPACDGIDHMGHTCEWRIKLLVEKHIVILTDAQLDEILAHADGEENYSIETLRHDRDLLVAHGMAANEIIKESCLFATVTAAAAFVWLDNVSKILPEEDVTRMAKNMLKTNG